MSVFAQAQARATSRLLSHVGEQAVLRGTDSCKAAIQYGVLVESVSDSYMGGGEVAMYRTVAFIEESLSPRTGDTLLVGGKTWVIDGVESGNGYLTRCILR